jgi:hypothetical protein
MQRFSAPGRDCPGIALAFKAGSGASSLVPAVNPHARESPMKTITEHYVDGAFVESYGREGMNTHQGACGSSRMPLMLSLNESTKERSS